LNLQPTEDHLQFIESDPKRGITAAKSTLTAEGLPLNDENILIAATCGDRGIAFLKGQGKIGVRKRSQRKGADMAATEQSADAAPSVCHVTLNGRDYRVLLDGSKALVNGVIYEVAVSGHGGEAKPMPMIAAAPVASVTASVPHVANAPAAPMPVAVPTVQNGVGQPVITQLPGLVLRLEKSVGATVKKGDTILVIESMKMDNAIVSSVAGTIAAIHVKQGDSVQAGQELALIS
jgi:pyruvate carboxylase subunit B